MIRRNTESTTDTESYHGLRMTADEYYALGETQARYELIDGVVCMSPSPTVVHQRVILRLATLIATYVEVNGPGEVFVELDVHLGKGPGGDDLVYRPDVIYLSRERLARCKDRVVGAPDLVIEVVSGSSRRMDVETKKNDYERCGVEEYWVIDPDQDHMFFHSLYGGRYVSLTPENDSLKSKAVPGFVLDLARVRASFKLP